MSPNKFKMLPTKQASLEKMAFIVRNYKLCTETRVVRTFNEDDKTQHFNPSIIFLN